MKRQKLQITASLSAAQTLHVTVPNRHQQCLSQFQHTISRLLTESPQQILAHLVPFTTSLDLAVHFSSMRSSLEFVCELNSLPFPYANKFPAIQQDTCASNRCHPLLLQILKPVRTTGEGNCMYNALSLTLTGTEQFSDLIRLLCAYTLVKYKDTMISAFADAFPSNTEASHEQMYHRTLVETLQVGVWGTDSQLFPLSLLMNRPVFHYNTFYVVSDTSGIMTLSVSNARDVADLARRFLAFDPDTRCHILYCSNVHRALLTSGDINALPYMPLCLFNVANQNWVAMLLQSHTVAQHLPIPLIRILTD